MQGTQSNITFTVTKTYFVYIISNKKLKPLYIGVTNNLNRRMHQHRNRLTTGFTYQYNLSLLLYYEEFFDINVAISREKQLKNWHREWKLNIIKKFNPEYENLAEDWY